MFISKRKKKMILLYSVYFSTRWSANTTNSFCLWCFTVNTTFSSPKFTMAFVTNFLVIQIYYNSESIFDFWPLQKARTEFLERTSHGFWLPSRSVMFRCLKMIPVGRNVNFEVSDRSNLTFRKTKRDSLKKTLL